jgi:hypothetical protein
MSEQDLPPSSKPFDSESLESVRATRMGISLDWWSVIIAIALAVLLRANLLPAIPWDTPVPTPAKTVPADGHSR